MSVIVIILLLAVFVSPFVYIDQHAQEYVDSRKEVFEWFKKKNPQKQRLYLIDKYLEKKPTRDWTIAFKGFRKDMTCRDFQYEEGRTYQLTGEGRPSLCTRGFHACLHPVDCSIYYNDYSDVYHIVYLKDIDSRRGVDSKICGGIIHIGPEIDRKYIQG